MRTFVAAILLLTIHVHAADLGDPAGELAVAKWMKGEPVAIANAGDRIVVIEFFATTSGPCRLVIPQLSAVHRRFNDDVTIIAVTEESREVVADFINGLRGQIVYSVAIDDMQQTHKRYIDAYDVPAIPHAFIIRNGKVLWHGHPMGGLEKAIDEILADIYDIKAAREALARDAQARRKMELLEGETQKYFALVAQSETPTNAAKIGEALVNAMLDHPRLLNEFAWTILTDPTVKSRDLSLALHAAKAAYDGPQNTDAAFADTYARALFENKRISQAVAIQKIAVAACSDTVLRAELEESLKMYLAAEAQGSK